MRGLFVYLQHDARLSCVRGHSHTRRFCPRPYVSHIGQHHGASARQGFHNGLCHFCGVGRGEQAAEDIFVAILVEHAARGILCHAACGLKHIGERNAEMAHAPGVQLHLILTDVAAHHRDLRHASRGEQTRTDGPVGQRAQVRQRSAVGGEADEHDFAKNG